VQFALGLLSPAVSADPAEMSVAATIATDNLISVRASADIIASSGSFSVLVSG
jgi:hypothetical protein